MVLPLKVLEKKIKDEILEMDEVTAIDQKEIRKHLYEKIITTEDVYLDTSSHQVFVRKLEKVGEVVLSRKESPEVSEEQRVEAYANAIIDSSLKLKNWNDQVENFLARVNFIASAHPEFAIEHFDKNAEKMVIKEICSSSKVEGNKKFKCDGFHLSYYGQEKLDLLDQAVPANFKLIGKGNRLI